ncbi:MAG: hypothetical protein JWM76_2543 [Pseudonocardiales bacterium]|nr:hypothetical protein [Pseudonocardiales bacterium]
MCLLSNRGPTCGAVRASQPGLALNLRAMQTALTVVALAFGVLGMVAGWLALRTLGRLRRSIGVLGRGSSGRRESLLEVVSRQVELTERTKQQFEELNLNVMAAVARYEASTRQEAAALQGSFAADLHSVRTDSAAQMTATRADVVAELEALKEIVNGELAQIRQGVEDQRDSAYDDIASERVRLATDNTLAKNQVRAAVERVEQAIDGSLRRVALVRFDAFDDLSGRLSFCLALLDGRGDGITLTSLAGRTETRLYAKPINAGKSVGELSPEERQALDAALRV